MQSGDKRALLSHAFLSQETRIVPISAGPDLFLDEVSYTPNFQAQFLIPETKGTHLKYDIFVMI